MKKRRPPRTSQTLNRTRTSSCNEDEEKYADQPGCGLSPRKVLKRSLETLQEDEGQVWCWCARTCGAWTPATSRGAWTRVETPRPCGQPSTPALAPGRYLWQSIGFAEPLRARAPARAAHRPALPLHGSTRPPPRPRRCMEGCRSIPSAAGMLRALPEVEDAMRAVDGSATCSTRPAWGGLPGYGGRTLRRAAGHLDLLQHPSSHTTRKAHGRPRPMSLTVAGRSRAGHATAGTPSGAARQMSHISSSLCRTLV